MSSGFSCSSEATASELQENLEDMFICCHMLKDVFNMFNPLWCMVVKNGLNHYDWDYFQITKNETLFRENKYTDRSV